MELDNRADNEEANAAQDRRKFPRFDVDFQIKIVASDRNDPEEIMKGVAINISKDGVCLKTNYQAPVAALLFLAVAYGGRDSLFLAEVIWKNKIDDQFMYGMHIVNWTFLDFQLERDIFSTPNQPQTRYKPTLQAVVPILV